MIVKGIIPARYGSTRFPGKAIAELCGKPVIYHVWQQSIKVKLLDAVIVATDDEKIRDVVLDFGGKAVMTSSDHISGTDRIAEVVKSLHCDVVVNIQGDEPLIEPESISCAIQPFLEDKNLKMATLKKRITDISELNNPNVVKVVTDESGNALYFSRSPIPYKKEWMNDGKIDKDSTFYPYKHIGLYVYSRDFLLELTKLTPTPLEISERLEQLRVLEHGYRIKVVETEFETIGIDTPEDLVRAKEYLLKNRI
jgi:3-deoxy-manno-octulosonate cytidylyltransferase (CMP-KDO synthetase)